MRGPDGDPLGAPSLELDEPEFEVSLPRGWRKPGPAVQERAEQITLGQVEDLADELGGEAPPIGYELVGLTPGPPEDSGSAEVSYEPVPNGTTLEQLVGATKHAIEATGGGLSDLQPYESPDLGGDETMAYTYDQEIAGIDSTWLTVQAIHGETGVSLNLSAPPGELERYEKDFDAIITSWAWLD